MSLHADQCVPDQHPNKSTKMLEASVITHARWARKLPQPLPLALGVHRCVHCRRVLYNDVHSALNALIWHSLRHAAPIQRNRLHKTVGRERSHNSKDKSAPCSPSALIRRPQQTLVFALPSFRGTRKVCPCAARQRHGQAWQVDGHHRTRRFTRNRYREVWRFCVRYRAHPGCLT